MNNESLVLTDISDGVATVTLNDPQTVNTLSDAMLRGLCDTWGGIAEDRTIRAVILRGAGKHFCAGHNLKEMTARRQDADGGFAYYQELFALCSRMMMAIVRLPQPVIAQVHGVATAAGCQLVASCDLVIAADTARFATPGVNIGLFCSTPMVALSRKVSAKHAMEMLLTGEFIDAERAYEIGLANKVVPATELEAATRTIVETIAAKSPIAIKIGKEAFYHQGEMTLEEAYAYTGGVMSRNMMKDDAERGIDAFIAKEELPEWSGS